MFFPYSRTSALNMNLVSFNYFIMNFYCIRARLVVFVYNNILKKTIFLLPIFYLKYLEPILYLLF